MRFLRMLTRQGKVRQAKQAETFEPVCPHVALIPHWESADDLGKPEKTSHYICQACNTSFSREEGEKLKTEEAERLRLANVERLKRQQ